MNVNIKNVDHRVSGKFPRPVKLNGTTLAWHSDEIEGWIEQTILNGEKDAS